MVEMTNQDSGQTTSMQMNEPDKDTKMQVDQTEEKLKAFSLEAKKAIQPSPDGPIVLIVMGMAGSGKTTFVHVSTS